MVAITESLRQAASEWANRSTGETLQLSDIVARYENVLPISVTRRVPGWLKGIQESFHVRFIRTNRLLSRQSFSTRVRPERVSALRNIAAVTEYSQELASTTREVLAKSVELSSSLDRSFPLRLVERIRQGSKPELSVEDLRQKLRELELMRVRLMNAGLLDKDQSEVQIPDEQVNEFTRVVLSIYAQDAQDKLKIFDELLGKIELLQSVINKRYAYKTFRIDRQEGFVFKTRGNKVLPLDSLSSGEQHELGLLYKLLFKVKPQSLILIDEPEISLHIAWQQEFLKDLIEIAKISNFGALIATHSPDIINDRWDVTVPLTGPEQG